MFEPKLHITSSKALAEENDCRSIEGTRLALATPYDTPSEITFMKYINLFLESKAFVSTMAHFVDRCVGPTWLQNRFPGVTTLVVAMSNSGWEAFLTPTLLTTRIETGTVDLGFIGYQPNLVAKQFGLSQMLSRSLYSWENDICWLERKLYALEYMDCMSFTRQ